MLGVSRGSLNGNPPFVHLECWHQLPDCLATLILVARTVDPLIFWENLSACQPRQCELVASCNTGIGSTYLDGFSPLQRNPEFIYAADDFT